MDFIVLHSDIVDRDSPGVFGPVFEQRGPPDFLFVFDMFWVMAEMHHSARSYIISLPVSSKTNIFSTQESKEYRRSITLYP